MRQISSAFDRDGKRKNRALTEPVRVRVCLPQIVEKLCQHVLRDRSDGRSQERFRVEIVSRVLLARRVQFLVAGELLERVDPRVRLD